MSSGFALLSRVWAEMGADRRLLENVDGPRAAIPLPARLAVDELAWASVAAAVLAGGVHPATIDPLRVAVAYRSDRVLSIDGTAPPVWSPFSGFWRTADGWVRTHGNYPHHAAALRTGLRLKDSADGDKVREALAALSSHEAVAAIVAAGGLVAPVLSESRSADEGHRQTPLLAVRRVATASSPRLPRVATARHPLAGIRILDLTRVIAGPVCTRTLALLGADVLRIDPPALPEPEWQHLDTGHGKRSALLDARSERVHELLAEADAVVLGYRPAAVQRLGLSPEHLSERYPGLIVAQLSAWGTDHPERAGFDSLVQAESGIALVESSDADRPGVLPAQALDHSAGYLLAAAVTTLLERRAHEGGSWSVETSLRRIAAELLGMPRRSEPDAEIAVDPAPHTARFSVGGSELITARPVVAGFEFAAPRPWGRDQARW